MRCALLNTAWLSSGLEGRARGSHSQLQSSECTHTQPASARPAPSRCTECAHPALLRLAVTHLESQCQLGMRSLSPAEYEQLVWAGRRAYAT